MSKKLLLIGILLPIFLTFALIAAGSPDMGVTYEPTKKSLRKHPVPDWFHDAKFGIFIHWSLSSVPAYAPVSDREIWQIAAEEGIEGQLKNNPYAEWYLNTMKIEGSPTSKYHRETYGEDFSYDDFVPVFNRESRKWNPAEWAALFKKAGARYAVLVTKHHDGFPLWPASRMNPFKGKGYRAERDIVGELTRAVRSEGLRMGVYYSGGLDWTFQTVPISNAATYLTNGPATCEYARYVDSHFRELIEKYEPDILWNDICYPPDGDYLKLFADFYNSNPEGVVNDRWMKYPKRGRWAMTRPPLKNIINWVGNRLMNAEGVSSPLPAHADFLTPEYKTLGEISEKKWECTRGIGYSFGYNRMENPGHYLKAEEAVRMLVDIVSKNGNLLLNVGPRADGSIPDGQIECITGIGKWLDVNGEAIYGTRPWVRAEGKTTAGLDIRFTKKGDSLNVVLMGAPNEPEIEILGLQPRPGTQISMMGHDGYLEWSRRGDNLVVELPSGLNDGPAHSILLSKLPHVPEGK